MAALPQTPKGNSSKWFIRSGLTAGRWLRPSGARTVWAYVCCRKPYMRYVLDGTIGGVRCCWSPFLDEISYVGVHVSWENDLLYRKWCMHGGGLLGRWEVKIDLNAFIITMGTELMLSTTGIHETKWDKIQKYVQSVKNTVLFAVFFRLC